MAAQTTPTEPSISSDYIIKTLDILSEQYDRADVDREFKKLLIKKGKLNLNNLYTTTLNGLHEQGVINSFTLELFKKTSLGLGFTWWTGGAGLNTSISTNFDYVMQGSDNSTNLSVTVGFGF